MARRRSRERRWSQDPDAVLRGDEPVELRALLRLIQDVNPTGREKDPVERARRYALKSSLQSLLLRRHADVLRVVKTVRPGIVGLRCTTAREDGGHARLELLDADARQIALDRLE
jgi:hypothetical protein